MNKVKFQQNGIVIFGNSEEQFVTDEFGNALALCTESFRQWIFSTYSNSSYDHDMEWVK